MCLNNQLCVAWRLQDSRESNHEDNADGNRDVTENHQDCVLLSSVELGEVGRDDHIFEYTSQKLEIISSVRVPDHSPGEAFTLSVLGSGFPVGSSIFAKHQAVKPIFAVSDLETHEAKFNTPCGQAMPANIMGSVCVSDSFCASHVASSSATQVDFEKFRILPLATEAVYNFCVCNSNCYKAEHWALAPGSYTMDAADHIWSTNVASLTRSSGTNNVIELSVTAQPGAVHLPSDWTIKIVKVNPNSASAACDPAAHPGFRGSRPRDSEQQLTFEYGGDTRNFDITLVPAKLDIGNYFVCQCVRTYTTESKPTSLGSCSGKWTPIPSADSAYLTVHAEDTDSSQPIGVYGQQYWSVSSRHGAQDII